MDFNSGFCYKMNQNSIIFVDYVVKIYNLIIDEIMEWVNEVLIFESNWIIHGWVEYNGKIGNLVLLIIDPGHL